MIPLRDDSPRPGTPVVSYALIGANIIIWLMSLSDPYRWTIQFGLIPWELLTGQVHPDSAMIGGVASIFTSMFMHSGFLHLAGNMLYMWIFSNNIEDDAGSLKFLIFYFLCGIGAALAQVAAVALSGPIPVNPLPLQMVLSGALRGPGTDAFIPMIGASGAIAGVLGAYILLYPRARIVTLFPIGFFLTTLRLSAMVVIGVWFLFQVVSGIAGGDGGVAWWAHVGGFLTGMALVKVMNIRPRIQPQTSNPGLRRGRFGEPQW